jgi:hypothetical protein
MLVAPKHVTGFCVAHYEYHCLLVRCSSLSCAVPCWQNCIPDRRTPTKQITVLHEHPESATQSVFVRSTILPRRLDIKSLGTVQQVSPLLRIAFHLSRLLSLMMKSTSSSPYRSPPSPPSHLTSTSPTSPEEWTDGIDIEKGRPTAVFRSAEPNAEVEEYDLLTASDLTSSYHQVDDAPRRQ